MTMNLTPTEWDYIFSTFKEFTRAEIKKTLEKCELLPTKSIVHMIHMAMSEVSRNLIIEVVKPLKAEIKELKDQLAVLDIIQITPEK